MTEIYNYVFHYNHYEELWWAIPRESYNDYWNGKKDNCLFSTTIKDLIDIIEDKWTY